MAPSYCYRFGATLAKVYSFATAAFAGPMIDGTWFGMQCVFNMQTASIALRAQAKMRQDELRAVQIVMF